MLTQRLGGFLQLDDNFIAGFAQAVKDNPGSCDEVWFTSKSGFPKLETHKKTVDDILVQAEKLRKIGVRVSLQIQSSIGHGEYMKTQDNTGLVYEGSPAEHLVGHDGTVANYCFCWRGEHFKEYLLSVVREFARIKPHTFWIDDDFRPNHHMPVRVGCFCDDCIKKFNEKYGTDFDREKLAYEINYGDVSVREKYAEFTREGLYDLMYEVAKTVHEVSPESSMGYQYCANGGYTGFGYGYIFDAMYKGTGKMPKSRPGGGAYWAHDPNEFIGKARFMDWANFQLPNNEIEKRPEIESLPNIVYGKSIQNTCFETTLYLAMGNDAMSYAIMQSPNEPVSYHAKMLGAFSKRREYWQKLIDANKDTVQSGLSIAYSPNRYKMKMEPENQPFDWKGEPCGVCDELWSIAAVPMCFKKGNPGTVLLHPEVVKHMADDEILDLLKKPVITDGKCIEILVERGFGEQLNITSELKAPGKFRERYLPEHIVNRQTEGAGTWVVSSFVAQDAYQYELKGDNIEPISEYELITPNGDENGEYGVACAVVTTSGGGRWAVHGQYPWSGLLSFDKRNQFINIANYISDGAIPVILKTPIQAIVLPRENENGEITSVSIVNKTVGDSEELLISIKNPASDKFTFVTFANGEVTEQSVKYTIENGEYLLRVPNISAWGVGTVFAG